MPKRSRSRSPRTSARWAAIPHPSAYQPNIEATVQRLEMAAPSFEFDDEGSASPWPMAARPISGLPHRDRGQGALFQGLHLPERALGDVPDRGPARGAAPRRPAGQPGRFPGPLLGDLSHLGGRALPQEADSRAPRAPPADAAAARWAGQRHPDPRPARQPGLPGRGGQGRGGRHRRGRAEGRQGANRRSGARADRGRGLHHRARRVWPGLGQGGVPDHRPPLPALQGGLRLPAARRRKTTTTTSPTTAFSTPASRRSAPRPGRPRRSRSPARRTSSSTCRACPCSTRSISSPR